MGPEVAIVGGGMFGTATALELTEAGADVTIYEAKDQILAGASGANQWRLHRGYHYPLSDATAEFCRRSEPKFRDRFKEAVVSDQSHYYAIDEESWVTSGEYMEFCERHGLEYKQVNLDLVDSTRIESVLRVEENRVNKDVLRDILRVSLDEMGVTVECNSRIRSTDELRGYDNIVVATYAHSNELLADYDSLRRRYRFEVCEIPEIRLPDNYTGNNIIVVYGPFMSVDHWGDSDTFVMGDYTHMVHGSNVGYKPEVPEAYKDLVNKGLVRDPEISNFENFRRHGKQYIPGVANCEYVGSMFTIRTKLPDVEDTDARPSIVQREGDVISVFGGKLATSVSSAEKITELII